MDDRLAAQDRLIMQHVLLGGTTSDSTGRKLISEFVAMAMQDERVSAVCRGGGIGEEDLQLMYATMVDSLRPNPCLDYNGPTLAASLAIGDVTCLQALAASIGGEVRAGMSSAERSRILVRQAVEHARRLWTTYNLPAGADAPAEAPVAAGEPGSVTPILLIVLAALLIILVVFWRMRS